jgi:hypothetical protein
MTTQEEARKILMTVTKMRHEDALEYLTAVLKQIHVKGEKSGVEQARQSLNLLQPAE